MTYQYPSENKRHIDEGLGSTGSSDFCKLKYMNYGETGTSGEEKDAKLRVEIRKNRCTEIIFRASKLVHISTCKF